MVEQSSDLKLYRVSRGPSRNGVTCVLVLASNESDAWKLAYQKFALAWTSPPHGPKKPQTDSSKLEVSLVLADLTRQWVSAVHEFSGDI